jgi:hypothetical protein
MQEVNIPLVIRGIGKGRDATAMKDGETDGYLVHFEGDPGPAFLSRQSFDKQVRYRGAMQAQANGATRKEAPRA